VHGIYETNFSGLMRDLFFEKA
jgi:hypothetical protein